MQILRLLEDCDCFDEVIEKLEKMKITYNRTEVLEIWNTYCACDSYIEMIKE